VPGHAGEICVVEIFGRDVRPPGARVGMGVHPFADADLTDDFEQVELAVDVTLMHTYSASWDPARVAWYVDDRLVRVVEQSPAYPLQLMLGLYEFPPPDGVAVARRAPDYPKHVEVEWVRGYRSVDATLT
jgi:hypothetical protein